jgi:hypothetical protein
LRFTLEPAGVYQMTYRASQSPRETASGRSRSLKIVKATDAIF